MSIVVSNPNQIHNSPLNASTAKALYSFPKAKRHDMAKKDINPSFYELPPVKNKRSAGFGYGNKYDFTKGFDKTPAPNCYEPKGTLDDERKVKGCSFGLSREVMAATGGMTTGDRNSPGPAAYNVRGLNQKNIAYTFRPKTTLDILVSNKTIPGPGAYAMVGTISKDGKYFVSKFKNSGAGVIAPATSKRAGIAEFRDVPGPGAYNPKTSISDTGNYFISGYKSSQCRSFGHAILRSSSSSAFGASNNVPGPGTYRLPSEFGYYENKNASQMDQSMRTRESKSVNRSQDHLESLQPSKMSTGRVSEPVLKSNKAPVKSTNKEEENKDNKPVSQAEVENKSQPNTDRNTEKVEDN